MENSQKVGYDVDEKQQHTVSGEELQLSTQFYRDRDISHKNSKDSGSSSRRDQSKARWKMDGVPIVPICNEQTLVHRRTRNSSVSDLFLSSHRERTWKECEIT